MGIFDDFQDEVALELKEAKKSKKVNKNKLNNFLSYLENNTSKITYHSIVEETYKLRKQFLNNHFELNKIFYDSVTKENLIEEQLGLVDQIIFIANKHIDKCVYAKQQTMVYEYLITHIITDQLNYISDHINEGISVLKGIKNSLNYDDRVIDFIQRMHNDVKFDIRDDRYTNIAWLNNLIIENYLKNVKVNEVKRVISYYTQSLSLLLSQFLDTSIDSIEYSPFIRKALKSISTSSIHLYLSNNLLLLELINNYTFRRSYISSLQDGRQKSYRSSLSRIHKQRIYSVKTYGLHDKEVNLVLINKKLSEMNPTKLRHQYIFLQDTLLALKKNFYYLYLYDCFFSSSYSYLLEERVKEYKVIAGTEFLLTMKKKEIDKYLEDQQKAINKAFVVYLSYIFLNYSINRKMK